MKKFFYGLFGLFFRLGRLLKVKKNRVTLLSPHRGGIHGSLDAVEEYLTQKGGFEIIRLSTTALKGGVKDVIKFFVISPIKLATSEFVFLNDNFMPMANLHFSEKTIVTQLWHGEGAFKKFGLLTYLSEEIANREVDCGKALTYVTCTSRNVAELYAEAFGVDKSQVLPYGSPRVDYLLNGEDKNYLKTRFTISHGECLGKKLVLYAPTFRENSDSDKEILNHIDVKAFKETLGDEYVLLVKLHPQVHTAEMPKGVIDVSDCDIGELTHICDILVTDYSSVCMDFALLLKPCIFYAYDLEEYKEDRSFCFDYEEYVPGPIVTEFSDVLKEIKNPPNTDKLRAFREFNFDYIDCHNTQRIVEHIISTRRG